MDVTGCGRLTTVASMTTTSPIDTALFPRKPELHGHCDDRFTPVRDAFLANFASGSELGASVCVTIDGEPVVDLWAGDAAPGGPQWAEDTIVNVYSTTKTMAGLCMLMLADRGQLDWNAPVAHYWPEFAANGKERVLVRHIMGHTSGLSGFEEPRTIEDLYDWEKVTSALAAQAPWWEPGEKAAYHAITLGYLQGEILRRITGRTIGEFFRSEVAGPLGADFHIGLDPAEDTRVSNLIPPSSADMGALEGTFTPGSIAWRILTNPLMTGVEPRTSQWRRAEIPAAGGFGNARSVARVHAAMACGGTLNGVDIISRDGLEIIFETQYQGHDDLFMAPTHYGMGYGLADETIPLPSPRSCYWGGWGGSKAIIDLDQRMSFAYVMNRMDAGLIDDKRGPAILLATYEVLLAG